jgi:hypothetical protein
MSKCKHELVQLTEHIFKCRKCGWLKVIKDDLK